MKIATYGFAEDQGRKLSRILQLSKTTAYQLVEFDPAHLPDLLLVFGEEQLAANDIASLPSSYHSRMILVGKRRPKTQDYPFIGYPLVSSRVLNALDQLTCANEEQFTPAQAESVQVEDAPVESTQIESTQVENAQVDETENSAPVAKPEDQPEEISPVAPELEPEPSQPVAQSSVAEESIPTAEVSPSEMDNEPTSEGAPETPVADSQQSLTETALESEPETDVEPAAEPVIVEAVEMPEPTTASTPVEAAGAETGERAYRVLVVDDSHPMQQALAKELQTQFDHLHIDFADEGLIALELVEQNAYDFIFLDIMMPGIDGFETCTRMRAMEKLKKLPIIMLSSKTSPLDEVKGIMAGSSTYLTKPINPEEFQKVIARIRKWVDNFS